MRRVAVGQGVACMEDVLAAWDWRAVRLPLHFSTGGSVREHLATLAEAATAAVRDGAELLVLQDLEAGPGDRVCDPHLAVAAVDKALREAMKEDGSSLRRDASVVLQAAGIRNVHDVMVALGFGAQALCAYAMMEKAMDGSPEPGKAAANVLEGLQKGMEKVLSTLGIHELRGYGRLVSAIGVSPEVLDVLAIPGFCASEGRGLGLDDLDAPGRAGAPDPRRRGEPLQGEAPPDVPQGVEGARARRDLGARLRGVRRDARPPRDGAAGRAAPRRAAPARAARGSGSPPTPSARPSASTPSPS